MSALSMPADQRRSFLAEPRVAILTLARPAPAPPLAAPVWHLVDDDGSIVVVTGRATEKARLAAIVGQASLVVQDPSPPYRFVTVSGPLAVGPAEDAHRAALAARYLPADAVDGYLAATADADVVLLRLQPQRWWSNDFSRLGG